MVAFSVIVVLVTGIVLLGLFSAGRQGADSDPTDSGQTAPAVPEIEANGYPISLGSTTPLEIMPCGKNLFLLTENSLTAFNDDGKDIYTVNHGFSKPVMKASEKRVLLYDQGGYQFRVDSSKSMMGSKKLTEKITCGAVSNSGYVAIATLTERYSVRLTVYDTSMKELLNWSGSDQIITDISFNKNSTVCAVTAYSVEAGTPYTNVIGLSFKKDKPELFETKLEHTMGLSVDYKSNGNIGVVSDQKSYILDSNGKIKEEIDHSGSLISFSNQLGGDIAVCTEQAQNTGVTSVVLVDTDGDITNGPEIQDKVTSVFAGEGRLLALTAGGLTVYDGQMNAVRTEQVTVNAMRAVCMEGKGYLLEAGELRQFGLS